MLTLSQTISLLKKENILKEWVLKKNWSYKIPQDTKEFSKLSYNSKDITTTTLFFCKGLTFKKEYLQQAVANGVTTYISEVLYEDIPATGIIVTDVKKALAILAQAFYGYPQEKLTLIAITGTKGKTTTNYFLYYLLKEAFPNQVAMTSTEETILDGKHFTKSSLSTPESLDLMEMMATAVKNGMKYFLMEVSSQAYKLDRVYGLTFDYGLFLNITPDHISPVEHPTFEDYFYCKRQLLKHSKQVILNEDTDYFAFLKEFTQENTEKLVTFGSKTGDVTYRPHHLQKDFQLKGTGDFSKISGDYSLSFPGDYNFSNACGALTLASLLGLSYETLVTGLKKTKVPGRMMEYQKTNGGIIYVDYAHNYASLKELLSFMKETYPDKKLVVLLGSPGDRGISRRSGFSKVLNTFADVVYLTADDPAKESLESINQEIKAGFTREFPVIEIADRKEAVLTALEKTDEQTVLILAAKGTDQSQRGPSGSVFYEGDDQLVELYLKEH